MIEPTLILVALAGLGLGGLYFGGLWWALHRGLASPRPAQWFLGSLLLRTSLTLGGFYVVAAGQWERLLVCLMGFVAARWAVMRFTRTLKAPLPAPEAPHAP